MKRTKDSAESPCDDDSKSGERFNALLGRVIRVSKEELAKREAEYKKARHIKKPSR